MPQCRTPLLPPENSSNPSPETPAMSKAAASSLPPPPPEVAHLVLVEQLQRHHLAPDASLLSKSAHSDLLQAVYAEAVAMVEEYQHAIAAGGAGADRGIDNLSKWNLVFELTLLGLIQLYECLDHHLVVAEAAQSLGITSDYHQVQQEQPAMTVLISHSTMQGFVSVCGIERSACNKMLQKYNAVLQVRTCSGCNIRSPYNDDCDSIEELVHRICAC